MTDESYDPTRNHCSDCGCLVYICTCVSATRADVTSKETNPKDAVGIRKWRHVTSIPFTVLWELGLAMMEGARKYGRHNYRDAGVRSSVYVDAAMGHIMQYWEGESIDAESGIHHITKAISSLTVLRDAQINGMCTDDRPPKVDLDAIRKNLTVGVEELFERHPNAVPAFTEREF